MTNGEGNGDKVRIARLEEWRHEMTRSYTKHLDDCDDFQRDIRDELRRNTQDHTDLKSGLTSLQLSVVEKVGKIDGRIRSMTTATRVLWAVATILAPILTAVALHLMGHLQGPGSP